MRSRKINVTATLGLLLAFAMLIGIVSNVVIPLNLKVTSLVLLGVIAAWYAKPIYLKWAGRLSEHQVTQILITIIGLMMIVQIWVLRFTPATVYHDPFRVLVQAEQLSHGDFNWGESVYFWRFPNNVSLTVLLSYWLRLTNLLHMSTSASIHVLSFIMLDGFIVAILRSVRRLSRQHGGVLLAGSFFLFSPFAYTYYLQVFYSDLPTLICLSITFNVLVGWHGFGRVKKILAGTVLVLSIVIGEVVKPNLIVLLVAVALLSIWLMTVDRKWLNILKGPLILITLGFILAGPVSAGLKSSSHFKNNNEYAFPTMHWVWMSYNPSASGRYDFHDVLTLSSIQGKKAKQAYLKKALPARLKRLGPLGIVKRWFQKAGILLNVSFMSRAYTGGFISAPKLYQRVEVPLAVFGQIIMRIGFILLYAETLLRCLRLWRTRTVAPEVDPRLTLTILTALGYLAFHTLLWETESRYGQVMIPLLGILCAVPSLATTSERQPIPRGHLAGMVSGLGVVATLLVYIVSPQALYQTRGVLVAGQLSQLSLQFDARRTWVKPFDTLSQRVTLNHVATHFSVSLAPAAELSGYLVNEQTKQHYALLRTESALVLTRPLKTGRYRIELRNDLQRPQSVLLTKTRSYWLAPHPLYINHQNHRYWSFVYEFLR